MSDPSPLLSTISQSSAAMVAIIGGFLVSRLVAMSSEREGIKRQLKEANERLQRLNEEFVPVHEYRLDNSVATMEGWFISELIDERDNVRDKSTSDLVAKHIPRGSSVEEMLPFAEKARSRVDEVFEDLLGHVRDIDTDQLQLDDLQERGLSYQPADQDLYEEVFAAIVRALPAPPSRWLPTTNYAALGNVTPAWMHEVDMRRLDESINQEDNLRIQVKSAEQDVSRLSHDLRVFAQPVGVLPAFWILALFSMLGIVVPLVVMAWSPTQLDVWAIVLLLACFVIGLAAVLLYIVWYLRQIADSD